jgi:NADH:ubiquinone oxidoreductase subunit 5 (subunit L)/multisubunit Na+/H+ antiporter MnhA subunit
LFRILGEAHVHDRIDVSVAQLPSAALAAGLCLAWVVGFQRRRLLPEPLRPVGAALYRLAANKYYVDEIYDRWIIRPFLAATNALSRVDRSVIDAAVDSTGRFGAWIGDMKERFDRRVVDYLVNATAEAVRGAGIALRRLQTGVVHHYLLVVVVAVVVLSLALRR